MNIYPFQSLRDQLIRLIGEQGYTKIQLQYEFYLDRHEFDKAAKLLDSNIIANKESLDRIINHTLSYKMAC